MEATYSYIQKRSNFQSLTELYSLHIGCYLYKPVLVVPPDGYILDIHFADSRNNDAPMLQGEFEAETGALREWLSDTFLQQGQSHFI